MGFRRCILDDIDITIFGVIYLIIVVALFLLILCAGSNKFNTTAFENNTSVVCSEDGVYYLVVDRYNKFGITVMLEDGPDGLQLKRCTPDTKE